MYLNPDKYKKEQERLQDLERKKAEAELVRQQQIKENTQETTKVDDRERGIIGRTIRGAAHTASKPLRYVGSGLRKNLGTPEGRRALAKKGIRFAGRTAARTVGAVAMGTVGLGIGMAGNDLEDVLTYGAGGAVLGATTLGGRLADGYDAVQNTFAEGYYGSANAAQVQARRDEVFLDNERRDFYSEEFGVKGGELDNVMRRVADYDVQGIKDDKQIKKTMKLEDSILRDLNSQIPEQGISAQEREQQEQQNAKLANERALIVSKLADNYNTEKLRVEPEYREKVQNQFKNSLKKSQPDLNDTQLNNYSKEMLQRLLQVKDIN